MTVHVVHAVTRFLGGDATKESWFWTSKSFFYNLFYFIYLGTIKKQGVGNNQSSRILISTAKNSMLRFVQNITSRLFY